jgi:putative membrane protein
MTRVGQYIKTGSRTIAAMQLAFVVVFVGLGWAPLDRTTWLMENALVGVGALAVWATRRRFYWSARSWALVLAFLCTHEVGTHFTYPQVPWALWMERLTGIDLPTVLGWQRNPYDRFVHLCYGLCFTLPLREIITAGLRSHGAWASLIAWSFILSTSMLYELMEWIGGSSMGAHGAAFVGAQNDFWDAQKDMAWAAGGSLLVLVCRGHGLKGRVKAPILGANVDQSTSRRSNI